MDAEVSFSPRSQLSESEPVTSSYREADLKLRDCDLGAIR